LGPTAAIPWYSGTKSEASLLDAAGPTVAGGLIIVNSGYDLYGSRPGNVLAAFAPARWRTDKKDHFT
jgi:hypothetical protein